ncbi:MAG: EAL domain-containing protein [Solirubrobacteraceae bacterium]|jgi:diguanylate cyclase (GGDEF)-like protein
MADLGESWTTQQLVEFLSLVSSFPDEQSAIGGAVERAAEALEAEVGAVVSDGQLLASTGFSADNVQTGLLVAAAEGKLTTIEVPGAGTCEVISVPLEDDMPGRLVLARCGEAFSRQEANLLRGMGRVLTLTLRLRDERALRERSEEQVLENARLLATLQKRQRELKLIGALERAALECPGWKRLTQDLVERVAAHLDVDHCAVLVFEPDDHQLRMIAAVGWPSSFIGHMTVPATLDTQGGRTVAGDQPLIIGDLSTDARFPGSVALREQGIVSGMSTPIRGHRHPYGGLGVHTTRHRHFTPEEASFLEIVAGVLGAAAERSAAEEEIRHQAVHDGLTGLPNRLLFEDRLSHALAASRRHDRGLAVLFVDLDNFKSINDSLGHSTGDKVLGVAAMRLAGCLRPEDTLARMGGDEFAIVLPEIGEPQDVSLAAERLQKALRGQITIAGGQRLIITASIGIAIASHEQLATAEELTRNADLGMHAAKHAGKGLVRFFAPSMHENAVLRLELTSDLRGALDGGQFIVHYQPIVTLADGAIAGAEALVRWNHPQRGLIAPGVFIGLAEDAGLIGEIGRLVLGQACNQMQRWREALNECRELFVTVNVSPLQLHSSRLLMDVETALRHSGLPPDRLILEITENVLCDRGSDVSQQLAELKRLGVRLAVDDFGTGYSALSYLQDMPVDILKIDKSFIDLLGSSIDNDQLVDSIINLAHGVHLQTVAEGIETQAQARTLRMMNSEFAQGFHFAKPLPAEQFEALLQAPMRTGWAPPPPHQHVAVRRAASVDRGR